MEQSDGRRARIIAIANQKGGVGKSTTAINLGAGLAFQGERILVVDLDPQGNTTSGLGIDRSSVEESTYDVLVTETPIDDVVEPTSVRDLFLVPATIDLAGAEIELESVNGAIELYLPAGVSARVDAETVNGSIDADDFGLEVEKGFVGRDLDGEIGGGDAKVSLDAVNGSIRIKKN